MLKTMLGINEMQEAPCSKAGAHHNRLTYKSQFGDYGLTADHNIHVLYDKLGAYEDLGTIEYLSNCVARIKDTEEKNVRNRESIT